MIMQLSKFLPYQLSVLSNKVSQGISKSYRKQHNISISEWRVLIILSENCEQTAKELVEYSQMDKVRISRTVKVLLDKKLITQKVCQNDARSKKYKLTNSGNDLIEAVKPKALEYEQLLISMLSEKQLNDFRNTIEILNQQTDKILQENS